jgi:hypothetical protein
VGIEKVDFPQNSKNLRDRKCLPEPRKSFVGHPDAILFCEFQEKEFFNSGGPGRWSGQSGKELVLAALFLHPEMERQAMEVGRLGSGGF